MSAVKDAITAIREALKLADDIKHAGESLKALASEVRDHEKRLIRLEAKWETAIELANLSGGRSSKQIQ
jgi:hypothetical protein